MLILLHRGEVVDAEHRSDEEHHRDQNEQPEPVPGEVRVAAREVERREDREDDQQPGEQPEPELALVRDR